MKGRNAFRADQGVSLLEILVAILLLAVVAISGGQVMRVTLGAIGSTRLLANREDRPARLRTIAMEYVQAETEFLRNWSYDYFRDDTLCAPPSAPTPFPAMRRVPATYLTSQEPRLPAPFAAADIIITSEPVVSPDALPNRCDPRRVTVNVYLSPSEAPALPGGAGGTTFLRGETVVGPR